MREWITYYTDRGYTGQALRRIVRLTVWGFAHTSADDRPNFPRRRDGER